MAISYTQSHATASASSSVSDAFGTALGNDLLIAIVTSDQVTIPSLACAGNTPGWIKVDDITYGTTRRTSIWYARALGGETNVSATWGVSGNHAIGLLWVGSPVTYNQVYPIITAIPGTGNPQGTPSAHPSGDGEFYIGWSTDQGESYTLAQLWTGAQSADIGDGIQNGTVGVVSHVYKALHGNVATDNVRYEVNAGFTAIEQGVLGVRVGAAAAGHKNLATTGVG